MDEGPMAIGVFAIEEVVSTSKPSSNSTVMIENVAVSANLRRLLQAPTPVRHAVDADRHAPTNRTF
jgi:hypothetical protein